LSEWQEGDGNSSIANTGVWNDNNDFNELSHEADEALRGRKLTSHIVTQVFFSSFV
jgi:hypothetical protein